MPQFRVSLKVLLVLLVQKEVHVIHAAAGCGCLAIVVVAVFTVANVSIFQRHQMETRLFVSNRPNEFYQFIESGRKLIAYVFVVIFFYLISVVWKLLVNW